MPGRTHKSSKYLISPSGSWPFVGQAYGRRPEMIKIIIKATGEIREVTRNEAFGLVDSGKAKVLTPEVEKKYQDRAMRAGRGRSYKTK